MGPKELLEMVGLTKSDSTTLISDLFANKKLKIVDNKIFVSDTEEINKQANYFRKMEKIEQARRKSSMLSVY